MFVCFYKKKKYRQNNRRKKIERNCQENPCKIAKITPQIEPIVISKLSVFINDFSLDACQLKVSHYRAEILTIFGSYFGRNDDFINSF